MMIKLIKCMHMLYILTLSYFTVSRTRSMDFYTLLWLSLIFLIEVSPPLVLDYHYLTDSASCRVTRTILVYMILRLSRGGEGRCNYHRADFPSSPLHCLSRCLLSFPLHDRIPRSVTCQLLLLKEFAHKQKQRSRALAKACTRE